ncbi:MAG: hypothetical protein M0P31_04075 [Solirubrobacteraceae bacterium]|nr:hypothetical protein [Solirubrobacteraceae bacterium]
MTRADRTADDPPFDVPDAIAALGPGVADDVRRLVHEARARQADEIASSLEQALVVVPRPARPLVRKVVLG